MKRASTARRFVADLEILSRLPRSACHSALVVEEYPFDHELLTLSRLYRTSRKAYLALGGAYVPRLACAARSLAGDLFENEIYYPPAHSEVMWFKDHHRELAEGEAEAEAAALLRFNEISVFHEQNHRVVWTLLPPAPTRERELRRYLNFAESLVVTLDAALADEAGTLSGAFQRMSLLYRRAADNRWHARSRAKYRSYLLAVFCATYCVLELVENADVAKAVDYLLPGQPKINRDATRFSLELSERFALVTSQQWQRRNWRTARTKLKRLRDDAPALRLAADPLDLGPELGVVGHVLEHYNL